MVEAEAVEWDRCGSVGYLAEWLGIYGGWAIGKRQSEGGIGSSSEGGRPLKVYIHMDL